MAEINIDPEIDIDPKTEIEDKVKAILKLIKDGELDMDGTPEEILKREPLAELVRICEEKLELELSNIMSIHREDKKNIMDLERTLKEQEELCQNLIKEYQHVDSKFEEKEEELRESIASKDRMIEDLERDLEEKGNETSTLLENISNHEEKLRLSNQKLQDTEQLLNEKEESFRKAEEELRESIASKDKMIDDLEHQVEVQKRGLEEKGNETGTLLENREEKFGDTEQLLSEKEESFGKVEEELQQVQRELEDRNATKVCAESVKNGIDTVSKKFSDDCNNYGVENFIANISRELQNVKDNVSEMNREKEKLQNDNNLFLEELRGKKEDELTLKEKVEKLGAKARKEEEKEEELRESIASKDKMIDDLKHQVEVQKRGLEEKRNETSTLLENLRNREEKLRDREQLLSEKEESFRKAQEELQQVQRELEDRNASKVCVDSVKIENTIANISRELQDVKEYVSEMNREKEKLQNDNQVLLEELRGKKEDELTLKEKIEKLEAKATMEEESEKLEIEGKNTEAIRQLSLKIDSLTEIVSKSGSNC